MKFIERIRVEIPRRFVRAKKGLMKTTAAVMAGAMLFGGAISAEAAGVRDVFDASYYSQTYSDLSAAFGTNAKALYGHYTTYGQTEGRNCTELVNVKKYREAYADLDAAFGDNWGAYLNHYLTYGVKEGRKSFGTFDAKAYADRYADLKAAFGYDVIALYRHYIMYGRAEGRDASSPAVVTYGGGSTTPVTPNPTPVTPGPIESVPVRVQNAEGGPAPRNVVIRFTRESGLLEGMSANTVSGNGSVSGNEPGTPDVPAQEPGVEYDPENGVYVVYVDEDGTYDISNFEPGVYSIDITAEGYMPLTLSSVTIDSGSSLPTFELLSSDGTGHLPIRGQVTDATNNQPIAGVTVNIRANWNNRTGAVIATTTADDAGNYYFELDRGYYTIEFAREGYVSEFVNVATSNQTPVRDGHLSIVADVNVTQYRIVLTWGETPRDLDSHLVGPTADNGYFHVYFGSKTYNDGNEFVASLDVDDTSSYGPETVTIVNAATDKTYYYSVHDYTNRLNPDSVQMAGSNANIKVYSGSVQLKEYNVNTTTSGNIWNVFKIENGRIVDINDYNSVYSTIYGDYAN